MNDACFPNTCAACIYIITVRLAGKSLWLSCWSDSERPQSASHCSVMLRPAGSVSAAGALKCEQTLLKYHNEVFFQRSCIKPRIVSSDAVKVHVTPVHMPGVNLCTCSISVCGKVTGNINILCGSYTFLTECKSVAILRREFLWHVENTYNSTCNLKA